MTFQATISNFLDALFTMLVRRLLLVMALETIHRCVGAVVATRALPIGIAMIHREGVSVNVDISPIAGIVTIGTLTRPMIGRAIVAGLTIRLATMIEIGWLPGTGRVTIRALSLVVVFRPVMTGLTIRKAIVIKVRSTPGTD